MELSENKFIQRFIEIATKIGQQVHLRSIRDAFATLSPLFIVAGLAVLINNVLFPWLLSGDTLAVSQNFGNNITRGTLEIASLLLAPTISFYLAANKSYRSPISMAVSVLATYIVMMPNEVTVTTVDGAEAVVTGVLTFQNLGTQSMFAGIIIGLVATELMLKLSTIEAMKIHLGEQVPPAVGNAFSLLIPIVITISLFSLLSLLLEQTLGMDLTELIVTFIQAPLRRVGTNLTGYLFLYSLGNFLFTLGIHQATINGPFTEPLMLQNMNENMQAYADGIEIPHILTSSFQTSFSQMGGTGATISLIIAIFVFSKNEQYKQVATLGVGPGIFEINEPIIFGLPIVYNLPMMIPFVALPIIQALVAYAATYAGLVSRTVVLIPWITPPIISGYLSTGGDWRAAVLQVLLVGLGVIVYLPFLKISEIVIARQAVAAEERNAEQ